ncbi:DUF262 domain-containing protein [Chryseobacterium sp. SSA4.19]|uniref:DUF262 domain-containing protein n=1 Tax=Chryseobacterium sp. SSA4.19 TaxID=2919915 RepID=UPI001F4DD839|nr:DUF262 domain-containing protein [Chryseobacterium sp. SSA4.19]MCJ8155709.1 DUF262 domain-containing protein [Chryseobacterium sp. SSA4.19]
MEINIKINNEEDILLRIDIEKVDENDGSVTFRLFSIVDGEIILKLRLKDDELIILEKKIEFEENLEELKEVLEEFLVQLNPSKQFTTEDTENDEDDSTPYDPDKIRVDTKTFSLRQIYDMITFGDINLTPDFQRNLVWDNQRKSRLIESILMRIPLPMFYFAQDDEGRISVVDGLQRLSTIKQFMDNEFHLRKLEYLGDKCNGKIYTHDNPEKAIDAKYYRWFNMTQITVNVIDPSSPFKLKYDIFRRINTGGQPLNAQEIRNCLSSDELRTTLRKMVNLQSFKEATGYSIKDVRMEAQELALRFILFHRKFEMDPALNNYNGSIESELNTLTEILSKDKKFTYSHYINLFDTAMQNAHHLFGRYSFRKCKIDHISEGAYRQLINKALFVSWAVLLSSIDTNKLKKQVDFESLALPLAEKVTNDQQLFMYLSYSTNAKANIQAAFKAADELILTILP